MSLLPDPDAIEAIAARIADHAELIAARARRLHAALAHSRWRGRAADCFHHGAATAVLDLQRAAAHLDEAAYCLRRHAEAVRAIRDDLVRAAHSGTHVLGDVVHGLEHSGLALVHGGATAVHDAAGLGDELDARRPGDLGRVA